MKVSFDYNKKTHLITNVSIIDDDKELDSSKIFSIISSIKKSKAKEKNLVILDNNRLILNEEVLSLLEANPGDRLILRFDNIDGCVYPIITKSEDSTGNLITSVKTVSFRGKQNDYLKRYGNVFHYEAYSFNSCKLIGETEVKEEKVEVNPLLSNDAINLINKPKIDFDDTKTYVPLLEEVKEEESLDEIFNNLDDLDLNDLQESQEKKEMSLDELLDSL